MGICFSVIRGRCVSGPTPNAHLAWAADQKAPAGLGQLVNKPLPLLVPCMRAGLRQYVSRIRRVLLMLPLHSHILEGRAEEKKPHQSGSSCEVVLYMLHTLHNLFIDVLEPLI